MNWNSKICPFCGETIPNHMTVCPICAEPLPSDSQYHQQNPEAVPPDAQSYGMNQTVMPQQGTPSAYQNLPPAKNNSKIIIFGIVAVVVLILLAIGGYFFYKKSKGGISSYKPPTTWTQIESISQNGVNINIEARAVPEHDKGMSQAIEVRAKIGGENQFANALGNLFLDKLSVAYQVDCPSQRVDQVAVLLFKNNQSENPVWKATKTRSATGKDKQMLLKFACGPDALATPTTTPKLESAPVQNQKPESEPAPISSSDSLVGNYSTDRHNIQITKEGGRYIYRSWNAPVTIGDGRPHFQMTGTDLVTVGAGNCARARLTMQTGNTIFEITEANRPAQCYSNGQTSGNADAELTIYINGNRKDHYWLYRK